jgi:DNA-binding PadR family transcriptional regulator
MNLSTKELAVLAIMNEEPSHGYVLLEKLKARNYEAWTVISIPTVYRTISSLEKKGFINSFIEQDGQGAPRKVYSLTDLGLEELKEGLKENLASPVKSPSSLDISISGISLLSKTEAIEAIQKYRKNLAESQDLMKTNKEKLDDNNWEVEALFRHAEMRFDAEFGFLRWLEGKIEKHLS